MKTAMEKKTGLMRLIGYLSFVVVLLYGITLFAVSCDNDEDPPLPPAVEKVVLAFGVDRVKVSFRLNRSWKIRLRKR